MSNQTGSLVLTCNISSEVSRRQGVKLPKTGGKIVIRKSKAGGNVYPFPLILMVLYVLLKVCLYFLMYSEGVIPNSLTNCSRK